VAGYSRLLTERGPSRSLPLGYRAFVPDGAAGGPPLVVVHGRSGRAARHFHAFLPAAIRLNLPVIVPTFDPDRFHGYQRLAGAEGPLAALRALHATLDDAHQALGVDTSHVDLLGFSGGAQFAHRHALLAPEQVRRLVVAAAGWYTLLDPARGFPYGTAAAPASGGVAADVDAFLRIPVHVLVGERDVVREASLRSSGAINRQQGPNRLTRALRWIDHVEDAARLRGVESCITFDLLPGCGHSFAEAVRRGSLVERALGFLHADSTEATPGTDRPCI
jgi:pimeloyl-ACP methyl ester carboxylesterase